ncbi:MAG: hypothetical protein BZ137_09795 [Methanosphaera sp. rholeuAM130]|nr:MAG: hypothetical protein BZ137_09795 [Methanosphaera sp. rholeuAM130]
MCIYGKLTDNTGKNIAYEKIQKKVNNKTYTLTTTKYGNYNINITANTIGKNNITTTYTGSNNYTKSTNKTTSCNQDTMNK